MNIRAASEKIRLDLYHLAKSDLPRALCEEDLSISAESRQEKDGVSAKVVIRRGSGGSEGVFFASFKRHIETRRAESAAIAAAWRRAAEPFIEKAPPYGTLTGVRPVKVALFYLKNGKSEAETRAVLEEDYFVAPEKAALLCDLAKRESEISLQKNDALLYFSIPFCPSRCSYCSFISSSAPKHLSLIPEYLEKMEREAALLAAYLREKGSRLRAFYMGGGTPGILTASQLDRLLKKAEEEFDLSACAEKCVELGRPETVTAEKLSVLVSHGVNRVCINPQSTSEKVLLEIGRGHGRKEFFRAMELAKDFPSLAVNCDLIAGLPGDGAESYLNSVREVLALDPASVTIHALCKKNASDLETAKGWKNLRESVEISHEMCINAGLFPYYLYRQKMAVEGLENLGFSKPGFASLYNLAMMEDLCDVYSLGAGGVTKTVPGSGRIRRYAAFKYPYEYVADFGKVEATLDRMRREEKP